MIGSVNGYMVTSSKRRGRRKKRVGIWKISQHTRRKKKKKNVRKQKFDPETMRIPMNHNMDCRYAGNFQVRASALCTFFFFFRARLVRGGRNTMSCLTANLWWIWGVQTTKMIFFLFFLNSFCKALDCSQIFPSLSINMVTCLTMRNARPPQVFSISLGAAGKVIFKPDWNLHQWSKQAGENAYSKTSPDKGKHTIFFFLMFPLSLVSNSTSKRITRSV